MFTIWLTCSVKVEINVLGLRPRTFNCQVENNKSCTCDLVKYHYLSVTSQQTNMKYVNGFKETNSHTETTNLKVCADSSFNVA